MASLDQHFEGLATLSPAQLRAEWRRLHRGQSLPEGLTASQLARSIAWRMQERAYGGLPSARRRELDRLAAELECAGEIDLGRVRQLKPGAQLVRRWQGEVYVVRVLDDGTFEHDGRTYSSLTQIAKEITGAAWSGPRFFGRKRPEGADQ